MSQFDNRNKLLPLITTFWMLGMLLVPGLAKPGYCLPGQRTLDPIPEATKPCTADEANWWQSLREASRDAITAIAREDKAAIKRSTDRYIGLLREGKEKSYRVPLPDRRPQLLYSSRSEYSKEARRKKLGGIIKVRLKVEADGTIGEAQVTRGLGYGLDEKAIESAERTLWLPAVKDGVFVTSWPVIEVEFHIRSSA
jgi:TonB family protein